MVVMYIILLYARRYFNGQTNNKLQTIIYYHTRYYHDIAAICFEFFPSGCNISRLYTSIITINFISALDFSEVPRSQDV